MLNLHDIARIKVLQKACDKASQKLQLSSIVLGIDIFGWIIYPNVPLFIVAMLIFSLAVYPSIQQLNFAKIQLRKTQAEIHSL